MADPEVDLFAGMKKKKKKQVTLDVEEPTPSTEVEAEPTPAAAAAPSPVVDATPTATDDTAPVDGDKPAEDGGDLFADMKKKKKKKKDIPLDLESAEPISVDGMDLKKKKSKKQTSDFAKELDEMDAEADGDDAVVDDGDLGDDIFAAAADGGADTGKEAWVIEGRDPTYPELLKRFFTLLHTHNPELAGEKRRYTIVPPQVAREGTKKTVFANLTDICRRMHRQPEHVIQFLYSELGTQGSIDGAQRLVMKGRYNQKQIENVLRKYIVEYVTCKICKSPDTLLGKENRLYFMTCESCGSRRSVSAIKAGYQAQIGKRIKAP
ncbi:domain found in IF2B/IF5-domain-containing protein [Naematelia encephala]|uniref:Domain found in IF2B/IF5-domain-containing protein n=1 Tax=Naematelia encephala TaxID=71784 RepID=A0A1Y2BJQ3_9TREE|nr:domain found in IF2B/IF5-domain-containing protein [Naematelia encephala]